MTLVELGMRVRDARKQKKLTQAALGERLGLSRQVILRLENGDAMEIGLARVLAIFEALDLDVELRPARPERPTLEEVYAENEAARKALAEAHRGRRSRV